MTDDIDSCCRSLSAAIVLQAYKDFCRYAKRYKSGKGDKEAYIKGMREIVAFVKSEWYTTLTSVPPEKFIKKLEEVINE